MYTSEKYRLDILTKQNKSYIHDAMDIHDFKDIQLWQKIILQPKKFQNQYDSIFIRGQIRYVSFQNIVNGHLSKKLQKLELKILLLPKKECISCKNNIRKSRKRIRKKFQRDADRFNETYMFHHWKSRRRWPLISL